MKRFFLIVIAVAMIVGALSAQSLSTGFGDVTPEEVEMSIYEPDTTASAVVLYKSGFFSAHSLEFTHYRRVKVLKKEGVSYAEFMVHTEVPSSVRGNVYNLVNGELEVVRLGRESIFRERVSSAVTLVRVALPDVKEGSVLEFEYREHLLPGSFSFQEDIPVVRAELIIERSDIIEFRQTQTGYEQVSGDGGTYFYATDMPAFKPEPFTNSVNNYITKSDFDILTVTLYGMVQHYSTSWEAINKNLMNHQRYGVIINARTNYLRDIARSIEARHSDPADKIRAAYDTIRSSVSWNSTVSMYTSAENLRRVLRDGSGNSADINMLLFHLLSHMNIRGEVVAMSTRQNGVMNPFFPSSHKFNYTIVRAFAGDQEFLLDATERHMPLGLLPLRALNERGRLVNMAIGDWLEIAPEKGETENIKYVVTLSDEGDFRGEATWLMEDYAAFNFRSAYHQEGSEEKYIERFEERKQGLTIHDYTISGMESIYNPITLSAEVVIGGAVQRVGDRMMINPFLVERLAENPFRSEERSYPVDFAYSREKLISVEIEIPEGYEVDQMPEDYNYSASDESFAVTVNYGFSDGKVKLDYSFAINRPIFLYTEYAMIRGLYDQVVSKHAEPVILKSITDGTR